MFSVALLCYLEARSIILVKEFTFLPLVYSLRTSSHSQIHAIQVLLFGKVCFTIAHNSNTKKVISYKTSRNFLTPSSYGVISFIKFRMISLFHEVGVLT